MTDDFLKKTRINALNNRSLFEQYAYKYIIEDLMQKNLQGDEKPRPLFEKETESLMPAAFVPGNIYAFIYKAEDENKLKVKTDDGNVMSFTDKLPVFLCLSFQGKNVCGINLNLCPFTVRTCILNEIQNIDPNFFDKGQKEQISVGHSPISENVIKTFSDSGMKDKFLNYISVKYKLSKSSIAYRSYSITKVKQLRMIENWQWKYIPFLNYKSSIKEQQLKAIQKSISSKGSASNL